jgi:hypothetical protein
MIKIVITEDQCNENEYYGETLELYNQLADIRGLAAGASPAWLVIYRDLMSLRIGIRHCRERLKFDTAMAEASSRSFLLWCLSNLYAEILKDEKHAQGCARKHGQSLEKAIDNKDKPAVKDKGDT